jgi:hypothetical protein
LSAWGGLKPGTTQGLQDRVGRGGELAREHGSSRGLQRVDSKCWRLGLACIVAADSGPGMGTPPVLPSLPLQQLHTPGPGWCIEKEHKLLRPDPGSPGREDIMAVPAYTEATGTLMGPINPPAEKKRGSPTPWASVSSPAEGAGSNALIAPDSSWSRSRKNSDNPNIGFPCLH